LESDQVKWKESLNRIENQYDQDFNIKMEGMALGILIEDIKEAMKQGVEGQLIVIYKPLLVNDDASNQMKEDTFISKLKSVINNTSNNI
jgi:hypothetical protein